MKKRLKFEEPKDEPTDMKSTSILIQNLPEKFIRMNVSFRETSGSRDVI